MCVYTYMCVSCVRKFRKNASFESFWKVTGSLFGCLFRKVWEAIGSLFGSPCAAYSGRSYKKPNGRRQEACFLV